MILKTTLKLDLYNSCDGRERSVVMTRENALKAAIRLLEDMEQTEELQEIILGLKKFEPASYRRKWNRQSIYEAVKVWSKIHGRYPTTKEMEYTRELPGAFTIRREYGVGSKEFLEAYFPLAGSRSNSIDDELLQSFIEEYERLRPSSAREYNERKDDKLPSWNVVARRLGVRRWSELLLLSGVELACLKQRGAVLKRLPDVAENGQPRYEIKRHN